MTTNHTKMLRAPRMSMVRGGGSWRLLRMGRAASASSRRVTSSPPAAARAVSASSRNSRHNGASGAPFSTATASVLSRSLLSDIQALQHLHAQLSMPQSSLAKSFEATLERLERCRSERRCVFVTGIGKSGIVARRLAATLASISVRSQWIHGSEWTHGDLGNLQAGDVIILLSHSGNTAELQSLPTLAALRDVDTIAIVGQSDCSMSETCSQTLVIPVSDPPHCPVPSRSIIVQEAMCNAIVEHFVDAIESQPDAFRANHPGGAIGDGFSKS